MKFRVQLDLSLGHNNLQIVEHCCNLSLNGSPPPPTLHPYKSTCGVGEKYLKWWEINLAVHYTSCSVIVNKQL